ncbi:lipopolysaccharide biosynthesis protein [Methylobacterium nigriterrae]|uniref:lipopolysaccharide biosynthesis protein n=1 Tax=Methylobacterium nigriterrae TaxID=3127512 RepID=UPI00301375B3
MQHQARKAHFWMVLDVLGDQGIPFAIFLVIARVIGPQAYGTFALAMAFVGLMSVVIYQGIADALIQVPELDERHVSTAFWMNLALASVIFLLVQVLARPVASLYGAPEMEPVLRCVALLAPLQALVSVQIVLFRRNLDTAALARRTFLGRSIGGVVGIALAFAGAGIWSLVALQLVQATVSVWVLWRADHWRPRPVFDLKEARAFARFGSHFMGATVVTELGTTADSLLVGLFLDPVTVGYYALAARLIEMARVVVLLPMRKLIMPVLSRLSDPKRFAASYNEMTRSVLAVWMPLLLALGTSADVLPVLFGVKWDGSSVLLQAMSLAAFTLPLWALVGDALSAAQRPDLYLRLAAIQVAILAAGITVGAQFGLVGVGLGWSAASACMVPIAFLALRKVCPMPWGPQLASALRVALAGLGFLAGFLAAFHLLGALGWPSWSRSLVATGLGLLLYTGLIEFLFLPGHVTSGLRSLRAVLVSRATPSNADLSRPAI